MAFERIRNSNPTLRLLAEFVVIVLGIVSALAVDGWSQGRAMAEQEYEYLTALRSDMEMNLEVTRHMARQHAFIAEAAELVLDAVLGDVAVDAGYRDLAVAVELTGWNLLTPFIWNTWDDLISTGSIDVIASPDIRVALQAFYSQLESLEILESEWFEYQQRYREQAGHVIDPRTRIELGGALVAGSDFSAEGFTGEGDVNALVAGLRATDRITGTLADIIMTHRAGVAWYGDLEDQIGQTSTLLDDEIGMSP